MTFQPGDKVIVRIPYSRERRGIIVNRVASTKYPQCARVHLFKQNGTLWKTPETINRDFIHPIYKHGERT